MSFTRGLFIMYCTIYLYKKLMNISAPSNLEIVFDICVSLLAGLFMTIFEIQLPLFRIAGLAIITFCYMMLYYKQPAYTTAAVTVVALGFSLLCFVLAGMLVSLVLVIVPRITTFSVNDIEALPVARITVGALQMLLAFLPFKWSRLENGMPFLQNVTFDEPCLFVGVLLIASTMFIRAEDTIVYFISSIIALGMLLFLIWYNRLQQSHLLKQEQQRAEAIEFERRQLEEEADAAAYAVSKEHHKNKRLTAAMQMLRDNGVDLGTDDSGLPRTYIDAVDLIVHYAAQRAADEGVNFEFTTVGRVKALVGGIVSEDELSTLLGDLLDNALMAVRFSDVKNIRLHIAAVNTAPVLAVFDSGIDFQPETIQRIGLECTTTHLPDGGSGLGLMTVFDILRTHRASFEIDETIRDRDKLHTKAVMICFDTQSKTRVKSRRKEILRLRSVRPDIEFEG